jgi:cytochrome c-type biogenesis protein
MLALLLAFSAGLLTVAAPCVLPILPIVFSSGLGAAGASRGRFADDTKDAAQDGTHSGTAMGKTANWQPVWMVLGFVTTFTGITITFSVASHLLGLSPNHVRNLAIGGLILFGAGMVWRQLWDAIFQALYRGLTTILGLMRLAGQQRTTHHFSTQPRVTSPSMASAAKGMQKHWGSFGLGMTLAVVWTPCAGPVLGSVLVLLATTPNPYSAAGQLLAFAIGAAIPMMAIAYGGQWVATRVHRIARYLPTVQRVFGVIVLLIALAMYFQYDLLITTWIAARFPSLAQGL